MKKEKDIITKTIVSSEQMLSLTVNNYIHAYKREGYVLVHQSPIMKGFWGTYSTTITMKKIDSLIDSLIDE